MFILSLVLFAMIYDGKIVKMGSSDLKMVKIVFFMSIFDPKYGTIPSGRGGEI